MNRYWSKSKSPGVYSLSCNNEEIITSRIIRTCYGFQCNKSLASFTYNITTITHSLISFHTHIYSFNYPIYKAHILRTIILFILTLSLFPPTKLLHAQTWPHSHPTYQKIDTLIIAPAVHATFFCHHLKASRSYRPENMWINIFSDAALTIVIFITTRYRILINCIVTWLSIDGTAWWRYPYKAEFTVEVVKVYCSSFLLLP